jgi:predicted nucleic acid-binding protein
MMQFGYVNAVFLPLGLAHDEALLAISDEVKRIGRTAQEMGLRVQGTVGEDANESQLLIIGTATHLSE